ncbi:MAG: hypothetical protein RBU27_04330, partial [Bacteroidota bacterium]|nr:hypothetical protein [Bacteroidota bacterium]
EHASPTETQRTPETPSTPLSAAIDPSALATVTPERFTGSPGTPPSHLPTGILAQQDVPLPASSAPGQVDTRGYFPTLRDDNGSRYLSIELRGVSATSFPDVTIGSRAQPWMENMAASLYFSGTQDDVGIEFGQEAFSQHYSGVEHGQAVRYEQNLLTSWLLAGYRHRFAPWRSLGSIEPYISTGVGSTFEAWPIARAGAGLMYMPDRRVRFHIGLEGVILAYPYQDRWFTSKRAGLTYGISVFL